MSASGSQVRAIARRSVARALRQPVLVVPSIFFPLFMMAVLSKAGAEITKVHSFPTKSYITWIISATLIQGAAGACTAAGNALGNDIETGFLSRISLTPVKTPALMVANLAGVAVLGLFESLLYLAVAFAAGASVKTGVGGFLAVVGIVMVIVLAFGAMGLFAAVLTRSAQQAQAAFVIVLGLLFMSSMLEPRQLLSGWFHTVATWNPMSYLVEAPRSLIVTGWNAQALELGLGIAIGLMLLFLTASAVGLRGSAMKQ